jgi:subtilisin-like proprotein convertase family protein
MRIFIFLLLTIFIKNTDAQTYSGTGGSIPDNGPFTAFPLNISGLSPSNIDTTFGLESVCINITHTWDADLNISIQSPNGTIVSLSNGNGGDGDNYSNTCFNAIAANSIVTGAAPFSGTFKPQGSLGLINNGQNGNGQWNLLVQDTYSADTGSVINWSITFGNNPAKPFNFISSNLPIVVINTFGTPIPDEPKINGQMGIIYNGIGIRNYLTNPFNNFNNKIGLEVRGSSSQSFPQKSYSIETRSIANIANDTILLGMPAEHDWILSAPYDDKTCLRNVLSYDIGNQMGHYASRTEHCELILNGEYQGIYIFMEKIKRDSNRVDIAKLKPTDITGDDLTGGYIVKIDKTTGGGSGWTSNYQSSTGMNISFLYHYPNENDIVIQQKNYIQSYIDTCESVLNGPNFSDPVNGYRKYMSVNSFIDYFILNEISKNVDGYRLSTFMHKDKQSNGGKLKIGPVWDYNLAWWNADYCEGFTSTGWAYQFNTVCPTDNWQVPFWWERLLQDNEFKNQLKCRWNQLRQSTLSIPTLNNYIDSLSNYLNESQTRHFTQWPIIGAYTWPNPSPIPISYAGEITAIKTWISDRINWLDSNMPGTCIVGINDTELSESNLMVSPNPFSDQIIISFTLKNATKVKLDIVDVLGNSIKSINSKFYNEGQNDLVIDFSNEFLKPGVYFVRLQTLNENTITRKIIKTN